MKGSISIQKCTMVLLACFLVFPVSRRIEAQQVQSDYEIQKNFTREVKAIHSSLDTLESIEGAEQIIGSIKTLENEYSEHEALLDKALYPETFDRRIEELKKRTVSVRQRLATIHSQNEKLAELNKRLEKFTGRLELLNSRTDSLRSAIAKSVQSEKSLSNRLRNYRESLEERDRLILSIIDSVLIAYKDLKIESMMDLENARKQSRIDAGGSPLKLIRSIAAENVQFLDSSPTLNTEDYLRMKAVQHEFRTMWEKTGDRLVEVYGESDNEEQISGTVRNLIAEWNKKVSNHLWNSMSRSFEETGIQLKEFSDSETFFAALNGYLDQQIKQSKENTFEESWKKYQRFSEFWNNRVKSKWAVYMTRSELLTEQQVDSVDQKMSRWTVQAEPASNMLAFLLGFSLLAVLVLGGMLYKEKANHS